MWLKLGTIGKAAFARDAVHRNGLNLPWTVKHRRDHAEETQNSCLGLRYTLHYEGVKMEYGPLAVVSHR
jgi:hypothetical protein